MLFGVLFGEGVVVMCLLGFVCFAFALFCMYACMYACMLGMCMLCFVCMLVCMFVCKFVCWVCVCWGGARGLLLGRVLL